MKRFVPAVIVGITIQAAVLTASAQTPDSLVVSTPDQAVEDYGREWRRARKMARACGASEPYMGFLSFMEGLLVAKKADEQRELGKPVEEDSGRYVLGFEDYLDVRASTCKTHEAAMAPIVSALGRAFEGNEEIPLFRMPNVACPSTHPC